MSRPKGASAPFSFAPLVRSRRADALLAQAAEDFRLGNFADALVAAESVCRMLPREAVPAVLRANILAKCRPTLAPRAWMAAWARDPLKPLLQDAMLEQWMAVGAQRRVAEQGVQFLPHRCRDRTEKPLLDLLKRAGVKRVGACWREGDDIVVRCFDLAGDSGPMRIVLATDEAQQVYDVPKDTGLRVKPAMTMKGEAVTPAQAGAAMTTSDAVIPASSRDPVSLRGVYSLAFDHGPLLQGSPISFDAPAPLENPPPIEPGVDIIIPVYRDAAGVQACLRSVLDTLPRNRTPARVIVVNDASPEPPLVLWLQSLAASGRIDLLHNRYNLGFIETVNRGLRAGRRDALMLNADTLVHGDWLDRLVAALYASADVASVMPWSNNAEIGSLAPRETDAPCSASDLALIDTAAARLRTTRQTHDMPVPTNIGFAMLMRRTVLDRIGLLDGEALTRGYNEEVDWCLRARAAGFRHLLATGVFVVHKGSASFGPEKQLRVRQNRAVIAARYPRYFDEYFDYLRRDPLRDARRRLLDAIRSAGSTWPASTAGARTRGESAAALKTTQRRLAVWDLEPGGRRESEILARARRLASDPLESTRLLVFGSASEALWHTGVVDVIAPIKSHDEPLTDEALARLAGCEVP